MSTQQPHTPTGAETTEGHAGDISPWEQLSEPNPHFHVLRSPEEVRVLSTGRLGLQARHADEVPWAGTAPSPTPAGWGGATSAVLPKLLVSRTVRQV